MTTVTAVATYEHEPDRRCRSQVESGALTWRCERFSAHTGLHYVTQPSLPETAVMWVDAADGPVEFLLQRFERMSDFVQDLCEAFPIVRRFASYQKLMDVTPHQHFPMSRRRRVDS